MKSVLLLFLALGLLSCQPQKGKPEESPKKRVEVVLQKIFVKDYPLYAHNGLIQEKAVKSFVRQLDSLVSLHGLEDIPLKVQSIDKNPNGKGAIVQFYSDPYAPSSPSNLAGCLGVGFIGLMSEELASRLTTNSTVLVRGHNYHRASQDQLDLIYSKTYYGAEAKVDGEPNFNIGTYMVEVEKFKFL